jgi:hypothetical protein
MPARFFTVASLVGLNFFEICIAASATARPHRQAYLTTFFHCPFCKNATTDQQRPILTGKHI